MGKIAINGFGRIGRAAFRILYERKKAGENIPEVVAINDLADSNTLAHLLKYDSIHGSFSGEIQVQGDRLCVDGTPIQIFSERDPSYIAGE